MHVRPLALPVALLLLLLVAPACSTPQHAPPLPPSADGPKGLISFSANGRIQQFDLATKAITDQGPGTDPFPGLYVLTDKKLCGKKDEDRCIMDSSTAKPVFTACKGCELPSLNADGTLIAYAGYCREKTCGAASHASFIRDRKGKVIHAFPSLSGPVWTPDGKLLMQGDPVQGRTGLWVAVDQAHEVRIDQSLSDPKELSVSPDGKLIAFKMSGLDSQLYVVGLDGKDAKKITDLGEHSIGWPAWSPDGKWLIFQDKEHSWQDGILSVVPSAGGKIAILPDDKGQPVRIRGRMAWRSPVTGAP